MSGRPNKTLPPAADPLSKGDGFGRPGGPIRPPLHTKADTTLTGQPVQHQEGQPTSRPGSARRGEPGRADSDHEPKAAAAPLASQSQPAVKSQGRRKRPKLPLPPVYLTRPTASLASRLRKERGPIDKSTAERLARFMVGMLTPRKPVGRQATEAVLKAVEMLQQGKEWPEIHPVAIPGYANMPFDERSYRKFNLRRAASAYERRRRRKGVCS
jgi:hypothetical protein